MNRLNKSLSMNAFRSWGEAFIPKKAKPDIHRESDAKTYSHGETVWTKSFKTRHVDLTMYVMRFMFLMPTLARRELFCKLKLICRLKNSFEKNWPLPFLL
jgi:hypothetical protein